ncbi:hypothetical protein H7I53_04290 [Mycolicibacterium pulveris]|uniref:Anti-sigma-M factor RsmA n=1 Tax=Mycolicibacterium pulveris TaxID=36813 RepID=A0A7I7UKD8_MYCPV|nr:hypothetical protein [Mycolicibacterium pulveris]MCV6979447.1 hypothetical protein [Mycolicibacterium pulveris]BBY81109.1 anti-sigma-M factor RsmA [Mycolicibacterium pulveris]
MDHDDRDPAAARVRDELARLGRDQASAPEVHDSVTARVVAALRAAGAGPAHSVRRPRLRRLQVLGLVVGIGAALVGVVVGVAMLADTPPTSRDPGPTARSMTVSPSTPPIPLSDAEILALLDRPADYGPLADPKPLASCLDGLGYSAVTPLGAGPVDVGGRAGVLLLLPGETDRAVVAVVVPPTCTAAHTGLLASTTLHRP